MADASSLTLSDYALMSNDQLIQKIAYSLLMQGNVLQDIPLVTDPTMVQHGSRFIGTSGNATVGFRKINEAPAVTKGVPKPFSEQAYIMSNNINIDTVLLKDRNRIQDPMALELDHYLKMVTYTLNDLFINNQHITGDQDAPVGLRYRLDNPTVYDIPTEMKIDANVDISAGSNGPALCKSLDRLLVRMGSPEGDGVVLYVDEELMVMLSFAIKTAGTAGGFSITTDAFDRSVTKYKSAKFRVIGRKSDQSTHIITTTEANTGVDGSSTYTSIYAVKFGEGAFRGWQFQSMESAVTGPYLLTASGTQMQLTFDYPFGFFQEHTRAIGRIYDIKVA